MRTNLFKKVLATVLATAVMWTSVAPSTVEAAKKDTKPTVVKVKVVDRTQNNIAGYGIGTGTGLAKNSRNKNTFKKGWHDLKTNTYYSCRDLQFRITDKTGIKSIKIEGVVRDFVKMDDFQFNSCYKRKVKKTIRVPKGKKTYTFKLSENLNKKEGVKSEHSLDTADGEYKLKVTDLKGKTRTIKFVIDSEAPLETGFDTTKEHLKGTKVVLKGNASIGYTLYQFDPLSGLDYVEYDGKKISAKKLTTFGANVYGKRTLVTLYDKAGNFKIVAIWGAYYK